MKLEPVPGNALAQRAVLEPEDVLREIERRVGLDLLPPSEEAAREAALVRIARLEPELLSALACAMLAEELRASRATDNEARFPFLPVYPERKP